MTAMRSLIVSASSWSCVTYTNVVRVRAWISLSSSCISWRSLRSSAPSGSSSSRAAGSLTSARASATRCCCPPESCPGRRSSMPSRRTERMRLRHARAQIVTADALHAQPERDVLEHVHVREERVGLEHHVDVPLGRRHVRDVAAAQQDAAAARLLEARDHAQRRRLAAARGAEHREELALVDLEGDVVDGDDVVEALRHRLEDDRFGRCCAGVARVQAASVEPYPRVRQRTPRAAASASAPASANAVASFASCATAPVDHRADQRADAPADAEQAHGDALADAGALGAVRRQRVGRDEADRLRDPARDHRRRRTRPCRAAAPWRRGRARAGACRGPRS